jgi:hypothetical protein
MGAVYTYVIRKRQFLATKVSLDQITFQDDGSFSLEDLELNVDALNRLLADAPVRVLTGRIGRIHGVVPVMAILTENVEFAIDGITLVLAAASSTDMATATASAFVQDLAASVSDEFYVRSRRGFDSKLAQLTLPAPTGRFGRHGQYATADS